jgi:SAM-dependent methyltransferase
MEDIRTASAFANSWNNLPPGSVYTEEQFEDWLAPVKREDVEGKSVLEMGCGNGSLLLHMIKWKPSYLEAVDLGDSVTSARTNLSQTQYKNWKITQSDITDYQSDGFDFVYCIGVLHHMKSPEKGLDAIIRNVRKGGSFHCWVYAKEGNALVIYLVEPLRRVFSCFPWWFTKYFVALPLSIPFYIYTRFICLLRNFKPVEKFPLYEYCLWIGNREFAFFRHVAFDQLVSPYTTYTGRQTIEKWLSSYEQIERNSVYIIMRNGNSWKFGGKIV